MALRRGKPFARGATQGGQIDPAENVREFLEFFERRGYQRIHPGAIAA